MKNTMIGLLLLLLAAALLLPILGLEIAAEFNQQPVLSLEILEKAFDGTVYGPYYPGETVYLRCIADHSDHIIVRTSSPRLVFKNPSGYTEDSGAFVERTSRSLFPYRSYVNGSSLQIRIKIPEGIAAGDYTISAAASDSIYDPNSDTGTEDISVDGAARAQVTIRIGDPDGGRDPVQFPYPELLEFTDLEESFERLAKNTVRYEYRGYVLEAIKYHIASYDAVRGEYRVAESLQQKDGMSGGNAVFFFDGVSVNLQANSGITPNIGYLKDQKSYNTSAVCIVVRRNDYGRAEIVFVSANASTTPDYVRDADGNATVKDGIYNIYAVNHQGLYASIQLQYGFEVPSVGCYTDQKTYLNDTTTGINLHARYWNDDICMQGEMQYADQMNNASSTGCFNIGLSSGSDAEREEYNRFMAAVTGIERAYTSKFTTEETLYGYCLASCIGIAVVDRSNYTDALAQIYGDDSVSTITGGQIAQALTDASAMWHDAVWANVNRRTASLQSPLRRRITVYPVFLKMVDAAPLFISSVNLKQLLLMYR